MTDFPSSPLTGDEYTENGITYIFDGTKWKPSGTKYSYGGSVITPVSGISTIDLNTGNFFELDISEQTEVQISNPPPVGKAQKFYIKFGVDSGYQDINGYDIENASYDNSSYNLTSQTVEPNGIDFKPDGTKMYIVDSDSDDQIHEYNLSTAWDLSTVSYTNNTFNVNGFASDLIFKPDGTRMFVVYSSPDTIAQFNLSTPWDITSASLNFTKSTSLQTETVQGIHFKPDGTKFYAVCLINDAVYQYSLSTPWDVSSTTYDNVSFSVSPGPRAIRFNDTGQKMFIFDDNFSSDFVYQYSLSTAWDLSTASYDNISFEYGSQESSIRDAVFDNIGTKMYIVGISNFTVYQYSIGDILNTPTVTWPTSFQWETGSPPTLPELGQTDLIEVTTSDGGTTYYAKLAEDNIS